MPLSHERAFLRLAGTWLACRWCVMGNDITEAEEVIIHRGATNFKTLGQHMMGCTDTQLELKRLCQTPE